MPIQALHGSSTSPSQYDSQSFHEKANKHSLAYTIKKTIGVAGVVLGGASLVAGITLASIATAGIAIPIVAPFVLGSIGASGITGASCFLSHMKFNQSTKNMSKAAHALKESADGLKGALKDQKDASNLTANMVENLENKYCDVNRNQKEIILGLKKNEKQIHTGIKKVEETGKELDAQISLLRALNRRLEEAEAARY